jgi:hypothetical protein
LAAGCWQRSEESVLEAMYWVLKALEAERKTIREIREIEYKGCWLTAGCQPIVASAAFQEFSR